MSKPGSRLVVGVDEAPLMLRGLMRKALEPAPVEVIDLPPMLGFAKPKSTHPERDPAWAPLVDLSGRPKVIVLRGPGLAGKTTDANLLASWLDVDGLLLGKTLMAATDPGVVSLPGFLPAKAVHMPANRTSEAAQELTRDVLAEAEGDDPPPVTLIDTGGGSTAIDEVLEKDPRAYARLEAKGVAVIEVWHWTPRFSDLALLNGARARTTARPTAVAMVLNGTFARDGWEVYRTIRHQPVYQAECRAGAAEVWMPALRQETALMVERRGILFHYARDGKVPLWKTGVQPVEGDASVEVGLWMAEAEDEWRAARSWVRP